jgi:putative membrane protein
MMPMWGWDNWWLMFLGILIMLLFWAGVIALVVLALRAIVQPSQRREDQGSSSLMSEAPLEILKKRYARGEITREEYLEARRDLEG